MKNFTVGIICLCLSMMLFAGCSDDSGNSEDVAPDPIENQNAAGVWLGYLAYETTTTFVIGLITEEEEARLIGDEVQYSGDLDLSYQPVGLTGRFIEYTWTSALYDADSSASLDFMGYVAERALILGGYTYDGDVSDTSGSLTLYYNTTYTISPNVARLGGEWQIENASEPGNTATLTIVPDVDSTTGGDITIQDANLNNFSNGRITILYSDYNVYRVRMNVNGVDLEGLATYVAEANTNGVELNRGVLAIGASGSGASTVKSFSGLAVRP